LRLQLSVINPEVEAQEQLWARVKEFSCIYEIRWLNWLVG
jgi:hypothetical protein